MIKMVPSPSACFILSNPFDADILTHKSRRSDQSSLADITGFPELCSVSQDQPMEEDHSFMMHSTSPDMLLGFTDHDDLHALLDDPHPA